MFYNGSYDHMFKKVEGKIKPSPKSLNFFFKNQKEVTKCKSIFCHSIARNFSMASLPTGL